MLTGAIEFFACDMTLKSIARVAARSQVIRVLLGQATTHDASGTLPEEIASELCNNFPQPGCVQEQRDVLYLAAYFINMPSRSNV
jgi:hypothetical protein